MPHLRRGAIKDFLKIMRSTGRYIDDHWSRGNFTYTFANGSYIEFFSVDQEDRVKGPRRNVLYVNECNLTSWDTYHQLSIRTDQEIWLDFNPSHEFWPHYELANDPEVDWLTLTYKDNEGLPISIVNEIEKARSKAFINPDGDLEDPENIISSYWANWWKVYGLGQIGKLEGVIFNNWGTIKGVPKDAKFIGAGLDFGFTNDPTALIGLYQYNGKRLFHQFIYETGLKNQDIARRMLDLGFRKNASIFADASEPKSRAEINEFGFSVRKADNAPGSINHGIDLLLEEDFLVTEESVETIADLRKYSWDRDKTGKSLNKPVDKNNHSPDAMRYIGAAKLSRRSRKGSGVRRRN